ncbi:hypothetical protein [Tenacibaculum aiptasiae]|uniref:hypothetical protein n=1 Tax=Tenacibaculum aiptasiae TaxID=426481 RepID=UPI00232DC125|nr:hypothetical protein [Tenacibaculum aiptasiae]
MKKSILNLGKALNKTEQQSINGGFSGGACYIIQENEFGILCSACCRQSGDVCVPDPTQICNN